MSLIVEILKMCKACVNGVNEFQQIGNELSLLAVGAENAFAMVKAGNALVKDSNSNIQAHPDFPTQVNLSALGLTPDAVSLGKKGAPATPNLPPSAVAAAQNNAFKGTQGAGVTTGLPLTPEQQAAADQAAADAKAAEEKAASDQAAADKAAADAAAKAKK